MTIANISERLLPPESLEVGEVVPIKDETVEFEGEKFDRLTYRVGDENDPVEATKLREIGDKFEQFLRQNPDLPVDGNIAADWLYREDSEQTSMLEWRKLFPTAKALFPLQRLGEAGLVLPGNRIDERALYLFTNMIDGIGLRARARVMSERLFRLAQARQEAGFEKLTTVSIGCGAAVPDIDAALRIKRELGMLTEINLVDPDENAKQLAHQLADRETELDVALFNDYGRRYPDAYQLGDESVDCVNVLGLWEYLEENSCVSLLEKTYKLLKPGGVFIASNMLSSRPQLQFNQKAVGWPKIKPRSEDELVSIIKEAGVPLGLLTMSYSEDGVYVVMEIKKP